MTEDPPIQEKTPGAMLQAMRKQQGKSAEDVALALKISKHRLRSIEADDFGDFPAETYVRGYLKNYGRLLNIDEIALMSAYEKIQVKEYDIGLQENREIPPNPEGKSRRLWLIFAILIIVVTLWAAAYWLLGDVNEWVDSAPADAGFALAISPPGAYAPWFDSSTPV